MIGEEGGGAGSGEPFQTQFQSPQKGPRGWMQRRRDRIVDRVRANRRGEYRVPTWVLATVLGVIVVGYVVLLIIT